MDAPPGKHPLLVVTGTTGSGKNRCAVSLAERLGGEILVLDSMKLYRHMDIGTDKPDAELQSRVPHHLIDLLEPWEDMNLSRFVERAHEARAAVRARDHLPIAVGGTALYLTGFLRGVFQGPGADPEFRRGLRAEAAVVGSPALHERLARVDPVAAERIHPNDYKRIERALEVFALTGRAISGLQDQWSRPPSGSYRLYVLTWDRALLDQRIDGRVDLMFEQGFLDEVRQIVDRGGFGPQSSQALGYREVLSHLAGDLTLPEAIELIKRGTRRFSRRQLTWFRRMKEATWIEGQRGDRIEHLEARILEDFLGSTG